MAAHVSDPSSTANSQTDSALWLKHPDEEQAHNVRIVGDGCGCGQVCVALVDASEGI